MEAVELAEPAATMDGPPHAVLAPLAGEPVQPTAPTKAATGAAEMHHDDENMTDDMRLAISALGLMREGSLSGKSPTPTPGTAAPFPFPLAQGGRAGANGVEGATANDGQEDARGRANSRILDSDPSRSASTASMASYSEAWTGSHTNETGYSSPATSMHMHQQYQNGVGHGADAPMGDGTGQGGGDDPHFMTRVSQLPIVSGGIEWYERSKANSRVVKYGADLVESSISAVSRPIANNLPLGGALDDFACRQLDRIGASPNRKSPRALPSGELGPGAQEHSNRVDDSASAPPYVEGDAVNAADGSVLAPGQGQLATIPHGQRSRWQTVLLEAGGLGAAVSEESLKSLRYCLQWLMYATAHLDHHIGSLRDFIASLRAQPRGGSTSHNALIAVSASAHLTQIKHDIVETIRKVVDVVSKYAGAALPEQAKRYVKQSILGLPVKWASAVEVRAGRRSRETSVGTAAMAVDSRTATPRPDRQHEQFNGARTGEAGAEGHSAKASSSAGGTGSQGDAYEFSPTEDAADRVLTFAVESLDMLRSVTSIFGESIEKAEAWIERLRVIGVDRQRQRHAAQEDDPAHGELPALPAPAVDDVSAASTAVPAQSAGVKRRRASGAGNNGGAKDPTGSASGDEEMADGEDAGSSRRKRGARRSS